jgi:hypothetical protein
MAPVNGSLERARAAKAGVRKSLGTNVDVVGIGVTKAGDGYALKINVGRMPKNALLPKEIDGIPVVYSVVGAARPR